MPSRDVMDLSLSGYQSIASTDVRIVPLKGNAVSDLFKDHLKPPVPELFPESNDCHDSSWDVIVDDLPR
jgi:hypothetical protein